MVKRFLILLMGMLGILAAGAQDFEPPIEFVAYLETDWSPSNKGSKQLKQDMHVSFDGHHLKMVWEDGKVFYEDTFANVTKMEIKKGIYRIVYTLEKKENGIKSYVILERSFDSWGVNTSIYIPYVTEIGMVFSYTQFSGADE